MVITFLTVPDFLTLRLESLSVTESTSGG
jgi:hypothetical protein